MLAALSAALALLAQDPTGPAPDPQAEEPVELDAVTVTGRRLDDLIKGFVGEVAAPNRDRGLARWDGRVCVGVANLRSDLAQYLVDRVSTVAEDVGLETGGPGCTPNILVVATDDGGGLAQALVEERARAFRMGGSGMDRGGAALRDFQQTDRPVRWWQMSVPVDADTGWRAVRIPGECTGACESPVDYAPVLTVTSPSRLRSRIVDNLSRTIVVVDIDDTAGKVTSTQLADYIAMVSLAQIDPDADTSRYATILNVFDDPTAADHLTGWDQAYLEGLYDAERGSAGRRAGRGEVVRSIHRAHVRANAAEDEVPAE